MSVIGSNAGVGARRWTRAAAVAILAGVVVAACGSDDEPQSASPDGLSEMEATLNDFMPGVPTELLEAACEEGTVEAVQLGAPNVEVVNEEFQTLFPCLRIEAIEGTGSVTMTRFLADQAAGDVPDVLHLNDIGTVKELADRGAWEEYTPQLADEYPDYGQQDQPGFWYPYAVLGAMIAYNPEVVDEQLVTQVETWAGFDTFCEPDFSDVPFGLSTSFGGPSGNAYFDFWLVIEEAGEDAVRCWYENAEVNGYDGSGQGISALSSGGIGIFVGTDIGVLAAVDSGAPIEVVYPTPVGAAPNAIAIAADAPHPNAAKLYTEFILSEKGQELIQRVTFAGAALPSVNAAREPVKDVTVPSPTFPWNVDQLAADYEGVNDFFGTLPEN